MRRSSEVVFATTNANKYAEARGILGGFGIRARRLRRTLAEPQSPSLRVIAAAKARLAFSICRRPVVAEDAGLFVDSLGGFPGPYSSYIASTIGNAGILRLVGRDRSARFVSVAAYCDGRTARTFTGVVRGSISRREGGGGWGFDPIFRADGAGPYSDAGAKARSSHRVLALGRFARWYLRNL
ncbi:MAG: non-canonical purine NTP pyrophosphatase [Nitrosopumilus sp.]|nr:non-canonical purine NTP pyrophosphatase [Nitrosopumilus sp.]